MRFERSSVCSMECVQCDYCGTTTVVEVVLDGEQFDPRSRSDGPPPHPFVKGKHACYACMKSGKHLEGRSAKPAGMLLAKSYEVVRCSDCQGGQGFQGCPTCNGHGRRYFYEDEEGLQLPERPYTEAEWEQVNRCGVLLHPSRSDRALICTMRDYWWRPAYTFDGSSTVARLARESVVLFMEPSERTPFRTVYEATLAAEPDAVAVREQYGTDAAERMVKDEEEALEVSLRVPMEILQ